MRLTRKYLEILNYHPLDLNDLARRIKKVLTQSGGRKKGASRGKILLANKCINYPVKLGIIKNIN